MKSKFILLVGLLVLFLNSYSQIEKPVNEITKEEILQLSYDDLLQLSFEDLLKLADKLGVSVDDLLNMKISVSSQSLMTPRESPGIVSIVTAQEIKNSGARDLIDILNLVPGFNFGYDIDGVIGLASRGNWGHEGKILVLLDGMEMNENFYSTFQFGNRLPVDQIQRIEIIRGPGSCIYGGYAELGVINIITKNYDDLKNAQITTSNGMMNKGVFRNDASFQKNGKVDDFTYAVGLAAGQGHRGNVNYTTFDPYTYDLSSNDGKFMNRYANVGLKYKNFQYRFLYDKFSTKSFEYGFNPDNSFEDFISDLKYDQKISEKVQLNGKFTVKQQIPWKLEDTAYLLEAQLPWSLQDSSYSYFRKNTRITAGLNSIVNFNDKFSVISGIEYLTDNAKDATRDSFSVFYNGKKNLTYSNFSAYLQGYLKTKYFNLNVGGRFDHHFTFGDNFAPRVGITKVSNKTHIKILYSKAFRTPAIENYNLNKDIQSEHTTVTELELGYQINKKMFVTANFFDIYIKNPIIYQYIDSLETEEYVNFESTGSKGFELEYRYMTSKASVSLNYSFYTSAYNKVLDYQVGENMSYYQAFPKHKITLNSSLKFGEHMIVAPSAIFEGPRYGYLESPDYKNKFKSSLYINLNLIYSNLLIKNLDLSLAVYNLLDEKTYYIQAYGNSFPALPGYSREISMKLNYQF